MSEQQKLGFLTQFRVVAKLLSQRRLPLELGMEQLRPLVQDGTGELMKRCSDELFRFMRGEVTLGEAEETMFYAV